MSHLNEPNKVKLFMGLIYQPDSAMKELTLKLEGKLSKIDFLSEEIAFDHRKKKKKEMGEGLLRKLITFEKLIRRTDIVEIKTFTNKLEEVFSYGGDRTINDLTLIYKANEYRTLEWTYPDYGNEEMRTLFKSLRKQYIKQLDEESDI